MTLQITKTQDKPQPRWIMAVLSTGPLAKYTDLKEFVHFSISHQRTMQGKHTDFMPLTKKH